MEIYLAVGGILGVAAIFGSVGKAIASSRKKRAEWEQTLTNLGIQEHPNGNLSGFYKNRKFTVQNIEQEESSSASRQVSMQLTLPMPADFKLTKRTKLAVVGLWSTPPVETGIELVDDNLIVETTNKQEAVALFRYLGSWLDMLVVDFQQDRITAIEGQRMFLPMKAGYLSDEVLDQVLGKLFSHLIEIERAQRKALQEYLSEQSLQCDSDGLLKGNSTLLIQALKAFSTASFTPESIRQLSREWMVQKIRLAIVFERQSTTFEHHFTDIYHLGSSIYGKVQDVLVVIRCPKGHSIEKRTFTYKSTISLWGQFHSWDATIQQAEFLLAE